MGCVAPYVIEALRQKTHYGPRVNSASKRNEYQGTSLGGKSGR
jgi:hypothetical protein